MPAAGRHPVPDAAVLEVERPHGNGVKWTKTLLKVDHIDVAYGHVQALRAISLELREREMVALVGANGAGKTTTLRAISGLVHPSRGTIELDGSPIHDMPAHRVVGQGIAHVPEGRDLFPNLTVVENLQLGHWIKRAGDGHFQTQRDKVMDFFPRLRERASQAAGTLSGGEQQMLVIARALMSDPRLLVVDELSLGLAPVIVQQLFDILRQVNQEGTTILLVEQFVHLALQNTDRAYALAKGEVVLEGRSRDLLDHPDLVAAYLGHGT
jgi:branched-chain amino acid transport system ATP-binding protein